jgi:chromate transporter
MSSISAEGTELASRCQPKNLVDLFLSFTWLALQGFGGVLAIIQRELVEKKRWLTREEFLEEWAVAQIMPGPNVINLALMIGGRYFGARGAAVAAAGMLAAPLLVVLVLAVAYAQLASHPGVAGALRGMGAVAAGLICATGIKLASALKGSVLGWLSCSLLMLATFVAIALLRWPMFVVLPVFGLTGCVLAWRALRGAEAA